MKVSNVRDENILIKVLIIRKSPTVAVTADNTAPLRPCCVLYADYLSNEDQLGKKWPYSETSVFILTNHDSLHHL